MDVLSTITSIVTSKLLALIQLQTHLLQDARGNLPTDIDCIDSQHFPQFNEARPIELIQEAGEVVFVPSGWHHWVENLCDTLSINHNWGRTCLAASSLTKQTIANACNLDLVLETLGVDVELARKEIDDVRDMEGWHAHCQLLVKVWPFRYVLRQADLCIGKLWPKF